MEGEGVRERLVIKMLHIIKKGRKFVNSLEIDANGKIPFGAPYFPINELN